MTENRIRFDLLFMALTALLAAGCSSQQSWLPMEFKLDRVLYHTGKVHSFGPGGINQSFTVYELPPEVSATIADKGLPYLNSLPSALAQKENSKPPNGYESVIKDGKKVPLMTGPWWGPFINWYATPVPREERWLRYGRDLGKDWKPSITTFYAGFKGDNENDKYISTISPEFSDAFHEAISTSGNFYAYGAYRGMCLVVVSPKLGKVFYLFRD